MDEELNEIIIYYEEEKTRIEELLAECLQFSDYKYANLFQNGLGILNNQLTILKSLKDSNYLKKKELKEQIENYHKLLLINPQISDYLNERIKRDEINLDDLSTYESRPFYDGQEFDDATFDLVEGKIQSFIFHLKKAINLYLKFECERNNFVISITPDEQMGREIHFPKAKKRLLKSIGFKRNKTKEYFQLKLPLLSFKDSQQIKIIVSKIIYEVFFINELDTETTIVIHS